MRRIGLLLAPAFAIYSAAAQDPAEVKQQVAKVKAELDQVVAKAQMIGLEGGVMNNIAGAPYSGEQIRETTQTLGDGTRIHNETSTKFYRDGQGRVRRETADSINIFDPVAGVGYNLNPKTMTATKMNVRIQLKTGPDSVSYTATTTSPDGKFVRVQAATKTADGEGGVQVQTEAERKMAAAAKATVAEGVGAGFGKPGQVFLDGPNGAFKLSVAGNGKHEDLGTQNIEGVTAQGSRNTRTIEVGEIGNDRPIQVVDERWYSPDLQLYVKTLHSDPRTGEETTQIVNIQRGEPDPSLFQVPASYTLIEPKTLPMKLLPPLPDFQKQLPDFQK